MKQIIGKQQRKINTTKSCLKKINKIDKPLTRVIILTKSKNERVVTITDFGDKKRLYWNANNSDNLEKRDKYCKDTNN